jgi:hypothetical protein
VHFQPARGGEYSAGADTPDPRRVEQRPQLPSSARRCPALGRAQGRPALPRSHRSRPVSPDRWRDCCGRGPGIRRRAIRHHRTPASVENSSHAPAIAFHATRHSRRCAAPSLPRFSYRLLPLSTAVQLTVPNGRPEEEQPRRAGAASWERPADHGGGLEALHRGPPMIRPIAITVTDGGRDSAWIRWSRSAVRWPGSVRRGRAGRSGRARGGAWRTRSRRPRAVARRG